MKEKNVSEKKHVHISLQTKLSLIILLAVMIPFTATVILLSGRIQRMTIAETIREEQVQTAKAAPILSAVLEDFVTLSRRIRSGEMTLTQAEEFSDKVTAARQYVDLPADDPFFSRSGKTGFAPMSEIKGTYWYGIMSATQPGTLFCPPRYMGITERERYADCAYVSATRIFDPDHGAMLSYLVLYFSSDLLKDIITESLTRPGSVSYIANEKDELVTSTDSTLAGIYYMNNVTIQTSLMSTNGFLETEVLGDTVYVSYFYLAPADWYLVTVTPKEPLEHEARNIVLFIGLLYIVFAAVALLIASLMARSIARRIGTVSEQMSAVKSGAPVPIETVRTDDEIGQLVDSYNYMARQINQLLEDQQNAAEELRVAEFRSLQSQINPHFLFNTMEMINQLASTGRINETNEAITALSRFYRLTLSRSGTMSTIAEEIEHVTVYIQIQNMRFNDGIDFMVDIPDEILDCSIPRLTFQPIVENSILHGILEKPDPRGTILLTGWMEDKDVCVLISDNGDGMSKERMDKILTGELNTGQGSQIAVVNTHRRLQLVFGEDYGLSYSSTPGLGTDVTIRISSSNPAN